jgi:hypothetical protein
MRTFPPIAPAASAAATVNKLFFSDDFREYRAQKKT